MKLNQRDHKIILKDQGMGYQSAEIIGKNIIYENDNLVEIDLSSNQLQSNFKIIAQAVRSNTRLVALTMKNNQINGHEHSDDIKMMIHNHPTLVKLDLSNEEMNINKNKLRNHGAISLIEGILTSE